MSELAPRLAVLRQEFEDVESSLGDPELIADQKRFQDVNRRYTRLRQLVTVWDKFEAASEDIEVAREMLGEANGEDADDLREEIV
ncbi:MAG: PCRF domain-containing protein, partial [Acidimicrobiales bacterium]